MSDITVIIILVIVAAMLVAFVIAIWFSYKVTRGMQEENKHLADMLHKQAVESKHRPLRDSELSEAAEQMAQTNARPDDELFAWIEQQIDERRLYADSDTSLKRISRELGLSQKRLSEVLSASPYGTLTELIANKRVQCACRLLETRTEWTIEAISAEAGFTTRRTFQNLFKAHTGVTPTQYRALKMRERVGGNDLVSDN